MNHQHEYFDPLPFSVENQQCEEYSNDYTGEHGANGTVCNTRTTKLIYKWSHTTTPHSTYPIVITREGQRWWVCNCGCKWYSETTPTNCFKYIFFLERQSWDNLIPPPPKKKILQVHVRRLWRILVKIDIYKFNRSSQILVQNIIYKYWIFCFRMYINNKPVGVLGADKN